MTMVMTVVVVTDDDDKCVRLQTQHVGDVMFSLSYLPSAERLTVIIVEARNLRLPSTNVTGLNQHAPVCLYSIQSVTTAGALLGRY